MKNNMPKLLILLLLSVASTRLLAADANDSDASGDLQQQLQTIQTTTQPVQTSATPSAAVTLPPPQATTTSTTTTTTAQSASSQADSSSASTATTPVPLPKEKMQLGSVDIRDQAFAKVTNSVLPLSPSQIEMLRNLYDATQRAAAVSPGVPPRPTSTSLAVNLSPGATPPVVRLGAGFVTSMVFVDSTGAPWPIDSYSLGNPQAFNIQWDKKSNILLVQAITAHRVGNLAVILRGLNTPVMIDLTPGQAALDVRVDLRIPGLGPQAKATYTGLPGPPSLVQMERMCMKWNQPL